MSRSLYQLFAVIYSMLISLKLIRSTQKN